MKRGESEFTLRLHEIESGALELNLNSDAVHLAAEIAAFEAEVDDERRIALILLVVLSMAALQEGSTRFPVTGPESVEPMRRLLAPLCGESFGAAGSETMRLAIEGLLTCNGAPALLGRSLDDFKPLIFVPPFIYQHRVLTTEVAIARRVTSLVNVQYRPSAKDAAAKIQLDLTTQSESRRAKYKLSEEQRAAIECAVTAPLTIISGGPGTGKTSIVLSILQLLISRGVDPGAIALAAPTGKAAYRIGESIRSELAGGLDNATNTTFPEPTTVHRMLGYSPERKRFRFHSGNPLNAEVVIIDEGSMLDLELMAHLLDALRPDARLVILGDADQLPSVAAGAVFRDLVPSSMNADSALAGNCVRLTRSYRVDVEGPGQAIFSLANAINSGDLNLNNGDACAIPARRESAREIVFAGAEWLDETGISAEFLERWYLEQVRDNREGDERPDRVYVSGPTDFARSECEALRRVFDKVSQARLLCLTRVLDSGSENLNWTMHRRVAYASEVAPDRYRFIAGEPVMMLRNDYDRMLFNGDQGVVLRVRRGNEDPTLMAVFARGDNFMAFPIDSLRDDLELCYALTVHKAQGSEFDSVAVILPEKDLPILSREILYTAVSRARKSVVVVGARNLFESGLSRRIERYSGVREHLAQCLNEARQR